MLKRDERNKYSQAGLKTVNERELLKKDWDWRNCTQGLISAIG